MHSSECCHYVFIQPVSIYVPFYVYFVFFQLLDLQLNDSNFRRYVLVQFLILFQYLNAQVKFKG